MFQTFRNTFFDQIYVSISQIELVFPNFNRKNLTYWQKKGYLLKLRNGLYTFSEYENMAGIHLYLANRICQPSYISLHYTLSFHGIIPEIITSITSVSTMKPKKFRNRFGDFSYQSVQPRIFFGYSIMHTASWDVLMATPEKAIIDLFYLYPMYDSSEEIKLLRFDESMLHKSVKPKKLDEFARRVNQSALTQRIEKMKKVYQL